MTALQIRDVPDDVRDALAERARQNGQSLNAYLRGVVVREASFLKNVRLIDEIREWPGEASFTASDVSNVLDESRRG
ncbi:MAG TPA: Arc family DNA-binding protein [Microbacterium sp.]|nr:Arc family DNA-binding protein [Microbacterium sp.]